MKISVHPKNILTPLIFVFLLFPLRAALAVDLSPAERDYLNRKGEIVFISQTRYPPFEFVDETGEHVGMCIELIRWMATELGFKARFTDSSFQEAQDAVLSGEADVLTSLFYSPKRDRVFDFSRMTFEVPASIFVAADRPDIKDIHDLEGKRIAMQTGDYAKEFLEEQGIDFRVVYTRNFALATDLVIEGKADAVIGDEQIVLYHIYRDGLAGQVKKVGAPLYIGRNCLGTREGSTELVAILNKGIKLAKRSGALERIERKWLGEIIAHPRSFFSRYLTHLLIGAASLLLIIILAWFWNLRLRQLVARRTADLKESEERLAYLSLAVESLGEMVIVTGLDHTITYANAAVKNILGYAPEEIIGHPASELFNGIPGNPPDLREWIWATSDKNSDVWRDELFDRRKDGALILVSLTLSWLRDTTGKIIGTVGVSMDITEHRKLEEQLRHSQKLEAVGTLAGGIAHDFNNILAGALGYLALMRKSLPEKSQLNSEMRTVEDLLWRGSDLTRALLAFSRKGAYQPEPLSINRVVEEVLEVIGRTAGKNINIRTDLAPDVLSIHGDRGQIHQVIMNLSLNACEAMPEVGTLTIRIGNAEPDDRFFRIHPNLKKGPHVVITITDTGRGFGEEMRERIFEPFFSTKIEKDGVGLGLSVVTGIVERHGGCIEVESEEGQGATFCVYLPATEEKERETTPSPAATSGGRETILVVDDNPDFLKTVSDSLRNIEYTVIETADGHKALEIITERREKIDLVVLDMIMKGLSGAETFRKIRGVIPGLPVIICTGYTLDSTAGRLLEEGACDFIQKPFKLEELAGKIRRILNGAIE